MKEIILSLSLTFTALLVNAQNGLDSVIVEKYYVSTTADVDATDTADEGVLPVGSVTYRVFLSLKSGYGLQALYGSDSIAADSSTSPPTPFFPGHPLIFKTSSPNFFNNTDRGSQYADRISKTSYLKSYNLALDSWLSVGADVNGQFGVLKSKDDGANNYLFPHSPAGMLSNTLAPVGIPLAIQDGIVSGGGKTPSKVADIGDAGTIADNVFGVNGTGNLFSVYDGSIYVSLGAGQASGTGPPADSTRVLIGQFTTDGIFEFELNVQITDTTMGDVQRFVARNPRENEKTIPSLVYRTLTTTMSSPAYVLKDSLANLAVTATGNGSISSVEFFVDGITIGTDSSFPFSYNWTATALGTHTLTSTATERDGTRVASPPVTITVPVSYPTVSIVSPVNTTTFITDSVATIITSVAESGSGIVDSVVFFMNGVKLGTDVSSPYTYTLTTNISGTFTLTAVAVDNNLIRTTSLPVTIVFGTKFPPAISITAPATASTYTLGSMVTINATSSELGGIIDSVVFFVDEIRIGCDLSSPYSINWFGNTAGTHTLTAITFDTSLVHETSQPVLILVKVPPTISITYPASNNTYRFDGTVYIDANSSEIGGVIDSVVFFVDGIRIGSDLSSPSSSITWIANAVGTHTLTAMAVDTSLATTTSLPVLILVKAFPRISITAPVYDTIYIVDSTVYIKANASELGGAIDSVVFFIDGIRIGDDLTPPYSYSITPTIGQHQLTAIAYDTNLVTATDYTFIRVVEYRPVVTITTPANAATYTVGNTVSINANASETNGVIDYVIFEVDGAIIGRDSSSSYSINWVANAVGTHTLMAMAFDTSSMYINTISQPVLIVVQDTPTVSIPPTVSITTDAATYTTGSVVTITATAADTNGVIDSVVFFVDGLRISKDMSVPYTTNWTSTVGTHTLTAMATDNNGAHTTSAAVIITVSPVTGINDITTANSLFVVYPNPATDVITIEINTTEQNSNVSYAVCDIIGNILLSKKIENINGSYKEVIDVSSFSKGLYIIRMVSDELNVTKKISIN